MDEMALMVQLIGLLLLVGGMWFGYSRWIRPHEATLTGAGRGLLWLMVATLIGGFIGSPFWWADQPWSFSWDLPPLASRMLAAAGWAFFAVTLLALRRPTYRRLRLMLLLNFIYLAPLGFAILLYHLDRFDFRAPITYGFFAIAVPMATAATWYLVRQPLIIASDERDSLRANVVVQAWLPIVAAITALWGIALLVTDNGPSALLWSWPGDLLTSRLIGVMLMTIAIGSLYSFRYADTARMMLIMILVYSLGITVASMWNMFYGLPIKILYASVFSVIFLVTAVLYLSDRQSNKILTRSTI
jgi:hypothetical protein